MAARPEVITQGRSHSKLAHDDAHASGPFREPFEVVIWELIDLPQALVLMGFPTVGFVGSIATAHLVESLQLREVGAVLSHTLPPTAVIRDSIGTSPIRVYLGDTMCGIDGRCDQLCVLHSDIAPKSSVVTAMAYTLVSWARARRARQLVCLEGLRVLPEEQALAMRQKVMKSLDERREEERVALMRSMDKVMFGPVGRMEKAKRQTVGR